MPWSEIRKKYFCDGRLRGYRAGGCSRAGTLVHTGYKYCSQHYPPNVKKRQRRSSDRVNRQVNTTLALTSAQGGEARAGDKIIDTVVLAAPNFSLDTLKRLAGLASSYRAAKKALTEAQKAYREAHR